LKQDSLVDAPVIRSEHNVTLSDSPRYGRLLTVMTSGTEARWLNFVCREDRIRGFQIRTIEYTPRNR